MLHPSSSSQYCAGRRLTLHIRTCAQSTAGLTLLRREGGGRKGGRGQWDGGEEGNKGREGGREGESKGREGGSDDARQAESVSGGMEGWDGR